MSRRARPAVRRSGGDLPTPETPTTPPSTDAAASGTRKWVAGTFAALAAVIAAFASFTSVFDWIERRVDPPEPSPPTVIDTRLLGLDLRREDETLRDYLRSTNQSLEGLSRAELREPGLVFAVRVTLKGEPKQHFPLLWSMYDVTRQRRLRGPIYNQEAVTFVPRGPNHSRTWRFWVPYPPRAGRYRVEALLVDEKRQPVDERDSRIFTVDDIPSVR